MTKEEVNKEIQTNLEEALENSIQVIAQYQNRLIHLAEQYLELSNRVEEENEVHDFATNILFEELGI